MRCTAGITFVALTVAGTMSGATVLQAQAGSRLHHHKGPPVHTLQDPETTGSLAHPFVGEGRFRDGQGRDQRSSTRGNAQFPERPPIQQNLGSTSGGPAF